MTTTYFSTTAASQTIRSGNGGYQEFERFEPAIQQGKFFYKR